LRSEVCSVGIAIHAILVKTVVIQTRLIGLLAEWAQSTTTTTTTRLELLSPLIGANGP
jgi:hypothetical protein